MAGLDWWVDYLRIPTPDLANALLDKAGIRREPVNWRTRADVPLPQPMVHHWHQQLRQGVRLLFILVIVAPQIAHGRMTVTSVRASGRVMIPFAGQWFGLNVLSKAGRWTEWRLGRWSGTSAYSLG